MPKKPSRPRDPQHNSIRQHPHKQPRQLQAFQSRQLLIHAPDRMRGRLQGVHSVVVAGGPRLGDLRAGATAAWLGPQASWAGGGFAAAGLAVALVAAFPALWRYRPPDDGGGTR